MPAEYADYGSNDGRTWTLIWGGTGNGQQSATIGTQSEYAVVWIFEVAGLTGVLASSALANDQAASTALAAPSQTSAGTAFFVAVQYAETVANLAAL
jgi:hypothetical protein